MSCQAESLSGNTKDSLSIRGDGAKSLNTKIQRLTYEDIFYRERMHRRGGDYMTYGFPMQKGNWCTNLLKTSVKLRDLQPNGHNTAQESLRNFLLVLSRRTLNIS